MSAETTKVRETPPAVAVVKPTGAAKSMIFANGEEYGPLPADLWPNVDHVITEDDTPVVSVWQKKMRIS